MDNKKICPSCNREIGEENKFCPYCGCNTQSTHSEVRYQLQPNTVLYNQYRIIGVIGEGNFGITYLAEDIKLQMKVAIKEFYPRGYVTRNSNFSSQITLYGGDKKGYIEKWKHDFIIEARNLAKLSGMPGVVEVKGYFDENETAYIVMEYLEGDDLEAYITKNGYTESNDAQNGLGKRITVEQAKQIMQPIIQSLSKVHEIGIVHRDISPDNIRYNTKGNWKVVDFGAARDFELVGTAGKTVMLKLGYAPEEQYRKTGNQGPWTDVYALCATIYKCITGIKPVEAIERSHQDTLVRPSQLGIQISSLDEAALMMGLAIKAENRFADMNALYKAFYEHGSGPEEGSGIKKESGPKEGSGLKALFIAIGAVVSVALIAIIIFLVINMDIFSRTERAVIKKDKKVEAAVTEASSVVEEEEEDALLTELQGMMDSQQYGALIEELLGLDEDDLTDEQAEVVETMLPAAISAQLSASYTNIDSLASSGNYEQAFMALEEERSYCEELATQEKAAEYIDFQSFDDKYASLMQGYQQYVINKADKCATQADEAGVEAVFAEADQKLSGEVYDKLKQKTYSTLIMKVASKMQTNGDSAANIMSYIEEKVHLTNNNCWVLELWDYFYAVYRIENNISSWDTTVKNVSNSGYILDYSDEYELTLNDISHLSRFELQVARFEIYARHGRCFNDPTVMSYFTQYSWYEPIFAPENFDENTLSDIEKKNANLILEYEIYMGYRNCR